MTSQAPRPHTGWLHTGISTVCGIGFLPLAPGTWGSVVAVLLFWFLIPVNFWVDLGLIFVVFTVGVWSSNIVENRSGITDPGFVIIDEVAGMWIGLLLVPKSLVLYLFAFVLFRIFDIWKPPPVDQLQEYPGGWGIMLDDVAAGIYTLILMQIGIYLI